MVFKRKLYIIQIPSKFVLSLGNFSKQGSKAKYHEPGCVALEEEGEKECAGNIALWKAMLFQEHSVPTKGMSKA